MDSAPESRVLIVMTGGTICMKPSPTGLVPAVNFLEEGMRDRPSFNDGSDPCQIPVVLDDNGTRREIGSLRTPISKFKRKVRYAVLEFEELLDSSSIDAAGWTAIGKTIHRNYALFDGFVVLHGTDSMAYTCSALSFMMQDLGKPIVLTGSQAPIFQLQNDATDNLLGALIIAGHFMIPEVTLFFHNQLFRGNRATKVSATEYMAFASPNYPPLASLTAVGVDVKWHLVQKATSIKPMTLHTEMNTAHVVCLRIFPGITVDLLRSVLEIPGLRGLVLESFGAGNTPQGPDGQLTKVLAAAVSRGIVIVNVTQCLSGSVRALYASATGLERAGVVLGQDLTSEAALTKLSYLMALPDATPESIAKQMTQSLRGELSEAADIVFQHPADEMLPALTTALASLGYAICEGDLHAVKNIISNTKRWMLNDADYLGNTPLHIAAATANADITRFLLSEGASVHVKNNMGESALTISLKAGRPLITSLLRQAGAHEQGV